MSRIAEHLIIGPVILPLVVGAFLLLLSERLRTLKAVVSVASTFTLLVIAIALLRNAAASFDATLAGGAVVYRLGNWPTPFAIVLVLDRLSALMLVLTSVLACASLVFSLARWHRAGAHFHALFQFLLMGLNGAFLTGDLFNLFVFFELLLAASYGLAMHGSGAARVKAGLHYIALNLAASLLFLIGVSLIYGVTGTLNMADLAARIPTIERESRILFEVGAGILGTAFLLKAGMWPLCFWLPATYVPAAPPVAAIFTIMTKVSVYIVLRLSLLLFGEQAGESAQFGTDWLLVGGIITIAFGTMGALASQNMQRLAAFSVLMSSGTMLAAIGMGQIGIIGGALFYLVSSTLGLGALFLLIELAERGREPAADMLAVTQEAYGEDGDDLDDAGEIGIAIPATMALLGLGFIASALVIAGLPPLPGFIAKFALLTAALNPSGMGASGTPAPSASWALVAMLILSGLATLIAMARAGIRTFWSSPDRAVPRVRVIEMAPIGALLILCAIQTVQAGPIMRYMQETATSLYAPENYIRDVLQSSPRYSHRRMDGI